MDPSNPSHLAKMFISYMNDGMDEELVRLYFESQAQEEVASSGRSKHQRRNAHRNHEEGHFSDILIYTDEQLRRRYQMHKHVFFPIILLIIYFIFYN